MAFICSEIDSDMLISDIFDGFTDAGLHYQSHPVRSQQYAVSMVLIHQNHVITVDNFFRAVVADQAGEIGRTPALYFLNIITRIGR